MLLTKSRYLAGLESHALLWRIVYDSESIPEPDETLRNRFSTGKEAEELAKKLYPGIDLSRLPFKNNLEATKDALGKKTIYEAGVMSGNLYARIDILRSDKGLELIEVKSSTKVKNIHLQDVAFQKYVLDKAGFSVKKVSMLIINNEYVRENDLEIEKLFKKVDVTEDVNALQPEVEENIKGMFQVLKYVEQPDFDPYDITKSEYGNIFIEEFLQGLPENNIFQFASIHKNKALELYNQGIIKMSDAPDFYLNDKQLIQKNNEEYIDKESIKKFLEKLKGNLNYLDFETFQTAIPLFNNTRPYQQIPFQYSLHLKGKHKEFLYEGYEDPRPSFIQALKKDIEPGPIIAFNMSFEKKILKDLARDFPEHKDFLDSLITRFIDLAEPFKKFNYYNQKQKGSYSLKAILPQFSNLNYEELNISDGEQASRAFYEMTYKIKKQNNKIREELLKYCELDTYAMILIHQKLEKLVR